MKKKKLIVGIDISKHSLDVCFLVNDDIRTHEHVVVSNDKKGIALLISKVKKFKIESDETLFCFESTGVYGMPLCYQLQSSDYTYCMVSGLEIKRSKGIVRGKTDKADALDIAEYAVTHFYKLKPTTLAEKDIAELRLLLSEREKLIKCMALLESTMEGFEFIEKNQIKELRKHNNKTRAMLKERIESIEELMDGVIKRNEVMTEQYALVTSIPGIGRQTAVQMIVTTRCFSSFQNWRKFACYAGIAPFEYRSGISVRGRTKVSHLADKRIKTILSMAALTAKKYDPELKIYYDRKKAEGKNGMLIMNAIRCKLVSRMFAVVKTKMPYEQRA